MNNIGLKNIFFIFIAALIICGALLVSQYMNNRPTGSVVATQENSLTAQISTSSIANISYNGDWKKTLLAAGTSSWVDSSNDTNSYFSPGQTVTGSTDLFAKKLFAQYVASKEEGDDTSATDTQQYIVNQVLSDGTLLPAAKVYDKSALSITSVNSSAALTKYGNDIALVFNTHTTNVTSNELTIVQDSLDKNDPTILKQLDPIIANNQSILNALLAIKVPSSVADLHLALINSISEILFIDQGFTKVYSDGLVSLQSVGLYKKSLTDLGTAFQNIVQYFNITGVTFGPNDPGVVFNNQSK